ncbi:hypothetical protein EZE58_13215 [Brevibacterium sp. LS14]|uniref:Uncharacterized protein n=1 Tax=Brevibacterium casei S18 TaxID=1229781 RepID=K9AYI2_9MICO|nr:hypothetical protein [Brevibacterium casei]EKU47617.1 hypothetical protein C272_07727 [Brevibacterium casei S18]NJE67832.1 hypothetical protein [Brevibacterium sp. LS14]
MTEKTPEIDPAFVTAARRQLDRIRWRREIDRAYRGGERAEAIADRLGESVDTIISEIRKLERRPNALVRTPKEVIDEYVVGERSRDDLVATLSSWPYTYGQLGVNDGVDILTSDAWDRGTWDDVKSARASHVIDDETFALIARAADLPAAVFPYWVNGPTQ